MKLYVNNVSPWNRRLLKQVASLDPVLRSIDFWATEASTIQSKWHSPRGLYVCRERNGRQLGAVLGYMSIRWQQEEAPWKIAMAAESPWLKTEFDWYGGKVTTGFVINALQWLPGADGVALALLDEVCLALDPEKRNMYRTFNVQRWRRDHFVVTSIVPETDLRLLKLMKQRGFLASDVLRSPEWFADEDGILMQYRLTLEPSREQH